MTFVVSPVWLLHVESNQAVPAELLDGIGEQQLADWEAEWVPELFRTVQVLNRAGIERQHWPQSRHWDWRRKTAALQGLLANPGFSVVCDGLTQGMMLLDLVSHKCRIKEQQDKELVYVEYVESAPWNRQELENKAPRYKGIGSILVRAAIQVSQEEEFKGRIGLHSLPQANSFYANTCGMTDLGPDPSYSNLRYFEMTSKQAEAFITKGDRR